MQNIAHTILKINQKPTAKFDTEPTRWSWAKQIGSYDTVPDLYKSFFDPFLATGRTFPYTVQTPAFDRYMYRSTEKLVCDLGDEIVILERYGDKFDVQRYPIEGIDYFEVRSILLDSQIKICGLNRNGAHTSSTLKFNSVTDYLFEPILQRARLAGVDARNTDQDSGIEQFDHLMMVNFKFMNYARQSVLAGEKVVHFILQPEIQGKILTILGKTFYRTIHPTHMVILTDRELIIIQEEKAQMGKGKYGGTWTYISLSKIEKLSTSVRDNNLLVLSIQLPGIASLEVPFQVSAKEDVDQLLADYGNKS
jgi:hypothetical protein